MKLNKVDIANLTEDELLALRICDLPLAIEGTWLADCIAQLYSELEGKGLKFRPICYLADEWLTPLGEPVIGIPFYLAHPALIRLEKKMMLEAEGESKEACMKLLRHECGHAISYAYQLHKKKRWQQIFGPSSKEYGDTFRFRPYSKNYVRHLDGFYAQFHPDEDFVETFAVWLTPSSNWQKTYQGWPALKKLLYVSDLMKGVIGKDPALPKGVKHWHVKNIKVTLNSFYKKKREFWAEEFPDFHDENLKKIFNVNSDTEHTVPGASFLKRYEKNIVADIVRWTGERKYVVSKLLNAMIQRSRELKLFAAAEQPIVLANVTVYITTLVMNYIYTGWYRGDEGKKKR
ncbi:MAG: putative zinc-binding metallopeptidase [Candidatus Omnitrophica bacterium]|nr:putative zinc-binding metallopeptidase [Candidatus Omnitrophota bacterium]